MAHLLSGERPALAAAPAHPFRGLVNWFTAARVRRAQRLALKTLLEYEPHRLEDLGITRLDLFEALEAPTSRPGLRLAGRRAQRSRNWLGL